MQRALTSKENVHAHVKIGIAAIGKFPKMLIYPFKVVRKLHKQENVTTENC